MPTILVEAVRANGEVVALAPGPPRDKARAQRLWGLRFTLTPNELGAYWQLVRAELRDGELPADTVRIRFQRALVSVDPDAPSRRPRPIGEIGSIAL